MIGWRWGVAGLAGALVAGCSGDDGRTVETALISPEQVIGDAIPAPLTDVAGDPVRGRDVFIDRDKGHCLLCHQVNGLDEPFQGNLGPALDGVGDRLSEGQLRLQVADARRVLPDTIMPSYYRTDGLTRVLAGEAGRPVLSAQEVEDLVAYLVTLRREEET